MEREPFQRESIQGGQAVAFEGVADRGDVEAGAMKECELIKDLRMPE